MQLGKAVNLKGGVIGSKHVDVEGEVEATVESNVMVGPSSRDGIQLT